ncbi:MAG: hypothetical protein C4519_13915 [Desulfobacteraceae bacterium]|nr:MAG: hypothetical protein C4519_13915 [Desulfobacteraceae bacterium]
MKRKTKTYIGITIVFALSASFFYWKPDGEFIQILAAIPLVGSLVGALFQLFRDQAAFEKELHLQESQNIYSLGTSSHMANTAFDKHVQFSEEYAEESHKALFTLFREGPTKEVLQHSFALHKIQQKYAVWLTSEIEKELNKFEATLRCIGADASYVYDSPQGPKRQEKLNSMYRAFAQAIGPELLGSDEWHGDKITDELAVTGLIRHLRKVLGTEELTKLREKLVSKTISEY